MPRPSGAKTLPTTPSDPTGTYRHALLLRQLTDELNATAEFDSAATLIDLVLQPNDGLLDHLADFFEAAGEKARESEHDDAFDLAADLQEAAAHTRQIGEDLHVATDRMRALAPRPPRRTAPVTAAGGPPLRPRPASGRTR